MNERTTAEAGVTIEEISYLGVDHFKISTPRATYYYDRPGGGFSRILDRDSTDWVAFQPEPEDYPASAAGASRGLPNLVYQGDDGGAGHPGFEQTVSEQIDERTIRTTSKSGKWAWTVRFSNDHVALTVYRVDPERAYWFLYEGPIGGSYDPEDEYWGTNEDGPRTDMPDYYPGERAYGTWNWAFFGDRKVDRVLFVVQQEEDDLTDMIGFLGNTEAGIESPDGMVVFGFGRYNENGPQYLMTRADQTFYVGFFEERVTDREAFQRLAAHIESILPQ